MSPAASMLPAVVDVLFPVRVKESRVTFVALKFVAKRFVVVALVPVAFVKVKDWSVEEPVTRRLANVPRPAVKLSEPMLIAPKPEVMEPALSAPVVVRLARVVIEGSVVVAVIQ